MAVCSLNAERILLKLHFEFNKELRVQASPEGYTCSRAPRPCDFDHNTITHAIAHPKRRTCLETTTTATALPSRGVGGSGGDILDASDTHTSTGKSTESGLGTRTGGLGAVSTGSPDLDVEGRDA